jgi:hypothetical protein
MIDLNREFENILGAVDNRDASYAFFTDADIFVRLESYVLEANTVLVDSDIS